MATTTPNFGWAVPTSTDLVKDGAVAIETLGDSIDASLVDLKGGTSGQVLAKASNTDMDFSWVTDAAGDISGVTAGTGISGGGTSGTVTITNSMATAIDAKGDLIGGTGADTFARLAVGANGTVLTADSAETTGLKWATPAGGGGMTVLATGTLSNQQLSITSISGSYQSLVLVVSNLTASTGHDLAVRFNGDSGSNYGRGQMRVDSANGNNGTIIAWDERVYFNSNSVDGTTLATLMLEIPFYALANTRHLGTGGAAFKNGFNSRWEMFSGPFVWNSTSAITSIATTATNYSGTYTLYGVN
jgi:hypothetical protein